MRNLTKDFENRKIDYQKLREYGFVKIANQYVYSTKLLNNQFEMIVNISDDMKTAKIIDSAIEAEYILVDIAKSSGEFVGTLREQYEEKLKDIIEKCTVSHVFKSEQAVAVIEYIKTKYNDELEFLWKKFDNNAIWRNKQTKKWYALLISLSKNKLGSIEDELIEIIDLRYQKNEIAEIIDNDKILPGYHMNKKSWITIKLDGSVDIQTIYDLIDNSYLLSLKK